MPSRGFSLLLLALVVSAWGTGACDRGPKPGPAPATSASVAPLREGLSSIHWSDAPIDWSRPLPVAPLTEQGYVGSEACKDCHADLARIYGRHSMARTGPRPLASLDAKWLAEIFDAGATQPVAHERSGFSYRPFRKGSDYFVEELVVDGDGAKVESWVQPLGFSYSAGSYGVAFYFRQGNRLYQIPIDYYPQARRWGLDPAAAVGNPRFSKALGSFCISCHTDNPRRQAGTDEVFLDPLPAGVGCERCHGPGQKHATTLLAADILNPSRLSPARQLDVCAQCHESSHSLLRADRGDFSYRPGEPLGAYRVNFVADPPEADRFALLAHPDRMVRSACWRGSAGKLVCTTCHDPHKSSFDQPASWWDAKCQGCHHDHPCTEDASVRAAQKDHCVPCHMRSGPPTSPPLVTVTDHWIQKRPPPIRPGSETAQHLVSWPDLVGSPVSGDDLAALDAVAHAGIGPRAEAESRAASLVAAGPRVPPLYEWLASRYSASGQPGNAARAYSALLRFAPDDPAGLYGYTRAMADQGPDGAPEALHAVDRMLALDPDDPPALEAKATLLVRSGRVDEARPLFVRAATEGPTSGAAHVALAVLARREGRDAAAIAELESARRIEPGDAWILDRLHDAYVKAGDPTSALGIERARRYFGPRQGSRPTDATRWLPDAWR